MPTSSSRPVLDPSQLAPEILQDLDYTLSAHCYTVDQVLAAIGPTAHAALARNSTVPATAALAGNDGPLASLIRLWPLQRSISGAAAEAALPGLVAPLVAAGILETDGTAVRAAVDLRPYATDTADYFVFSDLTPGLDTQVTAMRPDFVLGVSSASSTLAQLTVRAPVASALDLGTGCGVQTLHLAQHTQRVVATDVNSRALALASLTLGLNGVSAELLSGSLYEPVGGAKFDLITSNPPYVMSPPQPAEPRLAYRETSYRGDGLMEHLIRNAGRHLNPGGRCQILGNWAQLADRPWQQRLAEWVGGTGLDLHVVQREVLEPPAYVELWLADAGLSGAPDYRERYADWLNYFAELGIESVGMGWLQLTQAERADPWICLEEWPYAVEQPIAPAFADETVWVGNSRLRDEEVLGRSWQLTPGVVEESTGEPGAANPQHIVFRQPRGFRRALAADTVLAGVLGACDGELTLAVIIAALADLLEVEAADLTLDVLPRFRALIAEGWFGS